MGYPIEPGGVVGLCKCTLLMSARRRNHPAMHFTEHIPIVKQHLTIRESLKSANSQADYSNMDDPYLDTAWCFPV